MVRKTVRESNRIVIFDKPRREILRAKIDYINQCLHFTRRRISFERAQALLCEHYPHLVVQHSVKKEIVKGTIIYHIDWQGLFMNSTFQLIILELCRNTKHQDNE